MRKTARSLRDKTKSRLEKVEDNLSRVAKRGKKEKSFHLRGVKKVGGQEDDAEQVKGSPETQNTSIFSRDGEAPSTAPTSPRQPSKGAPRPVPEVIVEGTSAEGEATGALVDPNPEVTEFKRPMRCRWKWPKGEPLTDWTKLPPNWTHEEYDLDPDDYDAAIKRCLERIEDNIMPYIFENRLAELKKAKAAHDLKYAPYQRYGKLTWPVIKRIEELDSLQAMLEAKGDPFQELANVKAIIEAYKSAKLNKVQGEVTYWSKGKQIDGPKKFDPDAFRKINRKCDGYKGFWVERGNETTKKAFHAARYDTDDIGFTWMDYTVRLGPDLGDGSQGGGPKPGCNFTFLDDTGASDIMMYRDDLQVLQGSPAYTAYPVEQIMGYRKIECANGSTNWHPIFLMEIQIFNLPVANAPDRPFFREFVPVEITIDVDRDSTTSSTPRLAGAILRRLLYVGSEPGLNQAGNQQLTIATHKSAFTASIEARAPQTIAQYTTSFPFRSGGSGPAWYQTGNLFAPYEICAVELAVGTVAGAKAWRLPDGPRVNVPEIFHDGTNWVLAP